MTQSDALSILKTGANVFLTGAPGSGKTHTVNAYVAWLRDHGIEPAITASTGIASTHIRGMTIHSWSGIGIKESLSAQDLDAITTKEHIVRRIGKTRILIIDEVSMLSADTLDMVDTVLREIKQSDEPFGGIRVLLVGDFFQLPPVSKRGGASFAFDSQAWKKLNPVICYLTDQYRQGGGDLLDVLDAVRSGTFEPGHASRLLSRETGEAEDHIPRLYTHNADVDAENATRLAALPGSVKKFHMSSEGAPPLIEALKRGCLSPETLELKENAVVMFTKNNPGGGYMNGTLGIVTGFERSTGYPLVETKEGSEITVAPTDWAVEEGGKIRAKVNQMPLRLAWAITIHKSQGMSMDAAAIDLSKAFEYGQGYVALSRVRSLEGLHLLGWSEGALSLHPEVLARDEEFRSTSDAARDAFSKLPENERARIERNFVLTSGGSPEGGVLPKADEPKVSTYEETLTLLKSGKSAAEIAKSRGLTLTTVAGHLELLNSSGRVTAGMVRAAIPESLVEALPHIHEVMERIGADKLAPVHARLGGRYSYEDLKLARILYGS